MIFLCFFQIIWKRKRDRRWGLWRRKLNTASVGTNWSGVLWILSIRISVTFLDPDFCDFSWSGFLWLFWSGFLWLFMIWISVTFIDQDICDLYSSRFLWILFIQISVTFIDPDFCDFSWSEFLWLLLIRISVTFIHPDFYEFYLSRLLWLLLRLSTKIVFFLFNCSSSYLTETKVYSKIISVWAYFSYFVWLWGIYQSQYYA